jgi:hypothetical protein
MNLHLTFSIAPNTGIDVGAHFTEVHAGNCDDRLEAFAKPRGDSRQTDFLPPFSSLKISLQIAPLREAPTLPRCSDCHLVDDLDVVIRGRDVKTTGVTPGEDIRYSKWWYQSRLFLPG